MLQNNRSETRIIDGNDSSVEFKPASVGIAYQFKLRDYSSNGLGILVKADSDVLKALNVGDIMEMKYYPGGSQPVFLKTKIQHISQPEMGKHLNHLIVGLYIIE